MKNDNINNIIYLELLYITICLNLLLNFNSNILFVNHEKMWYFFIALSCILFLF